MGDRKIASLFTLQIFIFFLKLAIAALKKSQTSDEQSLRARIKLKAQRHAESLRPPANAPAMRHRWARSLPSDASGTPQSLRKDISAGYGAAQCIMPPTAGRADANRPLTDVCAAGVNRRHVLPLQHATGAAQAKPCLHAPPTVHHPTGRRPPRAAGRAARPQPFRTPLPNRHSGPTGRRAASDKTENSENRTTT